MGLILTFNLPAKPLHSVSTYPGTIVHNCIKYPGRSEGRQVGRKGRRVEGRKESLGLVVFKSEEELCVIEEELCVIEPF